MTDNALTPPTGNTPAVSLRARSSADLTQAILSPGDEAYVLDRARVVLKLYYDPAMDDLDRADMLDEFGKALSNIPKWAVAKGFDEWARTMSRRPSPAEIGILAGRAMKSLTDELADRAKVSQASAPIEPRSDAEKDRATETMLQAGFTPKRIDAVRKRPMARTDTELYADDTAPKKPHWTETVAPDDPEMEALRRARAANPLMAQAIAARAKAEDDAA